MALKLIYILICDVVSLSNMFITIISYINGNIGNIQAISIQISFSKFGYIDIYRDNTIAIYGHTMGDVFPTIYMAIYFLNYHIPLLYGSRYNSIAATMYF